MDDDTATEILEATYRALCEHGYADLTLKDIANATDWSKASIHYYYDSKENLFIEFLDFLYDRYTAQLPSVDGGTPREQLYALLETVLTDEEAASDHEFRTALLEVNAQAPYNDAIQTRLSNFDETLLERVQHIVAAGIETGDFNASIDPAVAADFLVTSITGVHTRRVVVEHPSEQLYETVLQYTDTYLVADTLPEAAH